MHMIMIGMYFNGIGNTSISASLMSNVLFQRYVSSPSVTLKVMSYVLSERSIDIFLPVLSITPSPSISHSNSEPLGA